MSNDGRGPPLLYDLGNAFKLSEQSDERLLNFKHHPRPQFGNHLCVPAELDRVAKPLLAMKQDGSS